MRVELNADQIERQLRAKERTIAMRLDRLFPSRLGPRLGASSTARARLDPERWPWSSQALVIGGAGLVLLGSLDRPLRRKASRGRPRVAGGRLALFVGVTALAYVAGRHLAEKRAVLVAARTSASPPAGAPL